VSDLRCDAPVALHLSEVAHAPQQPVCDSRGPPRPPREFEGAIVRDGYAEDAGRSQNYLRQLLRVVVVQALRHAEARPERRRKEPRPGRCTHEREVLQVELDASGGRALVQNDVDRKLLHRGVEILFYHVLKPVDLVYEKDVTALEVRQDSRQIVGALDDRSRGRDELGSHLRSNDVRQRGLAQARRPVEETVVQRLLALPCRLDEG